MTLLEALVALVILGLGATGYLGVFQQSARSARDASEWTRIVAYAESGLEAATLGAAPADTLEGYARVVERRAWRGGIDELDVSVTAPSGRRFTLRRLVARPLGTAERVR